MNVSSGAVAPKLKKIMVLATACAVVAAGGVSQSVPAFAASGGVSVSDGDGDGGDKYKRIYRKFTRKDKRWGKRTAECESGKDPNAIGGGGKYRGAFQFMKQTWRQAPKSPGGDPIDYNYKTQAVVAIKLKHRQGTSPWPVCG